MSPLTIGQTAKRAGVGTETVRFYERQGLIDKPPRRPSGYRAYPVTTVDRLRFIKRAKELGFSLQEIKELMALRITPGTTCEQIRARAHAKSDDIADRIRLLQRMNGALKTLTDACDGKGPMRECPILDALETSEQS
jgi:MerR family transcriptional regulator, copper efflux regulator